MTWRAFVILLIFISLILKYLFENVRWRKVRLNRDSFDRQPIVSKNKFLTQLFMFNVMTFVFGIYRITLKIIGMNPLMLTLNLTLNFNAQVTVPLILRVKSCWNYCKNHNVYFCSKYTYVNRQTLLYKQSAESFWV